MKSRTKRINKTRTVIFGIAFFLLATTIVMSAVLIYDAVYAKCGGNRTIISVTMLFVILVLAAVCTVVYELKTRIVTDKPVRQILDATDAIATGDFSVRLNVRHKAKYYDEYDFIMENLNKMAAELSKSELLHEDFISSVSHELKTPLSVIRTYAAPLGNDGLPAEKRREYADILTSAATRLTNLITNILKLSKLENSEIKEGSESVRLDESIATVALGLEELVEKKGLELDCDLGEVTVTSFPSYLETIWSNLLSNAVKFTREGGKISVRLYEDGGKAVVKVSDTGCGISREVGERIFDKFYQGDKSHSSEGNGLGLAIVKKIIGVIGGEIYVESEVGKGSTFTVILSKDI